MQPDANALTLTRRLRLLGTLVLVVVVLVACSGSARDGELRDGAVPGSPQVQIEVLLNNGWVAVSEGIVLSPMPQFRARVNDRNRIVTVESRFGDGTWSTLTLNGETAMFEPPSPLASGNRSVAVRATNSVGNAAEASANFTVDGTEPVIESLVIDGVEYAGATIPNIEYLVGPSSSVTLTVAATDGGSMSGVTVVLEALTTGDVFQSVAPGVLSVVLRDADLVEGANAFRLYAVDAAGNASGGYSFTVLVGNPDEHVAPVVTILAPEDGADFAVGASIRVLIEVEQGTQPVGTVQVQLDGVDLVQEDPNVFVGTVPNSAGTYLLTANAVSAGAVPLRSSVAFQNVTVRADAPLVEILAPEEDWIYGPGSTVEVSLAVTDQGGGIGDVFVTLDGQSMTSADERNFTIAAPLETDEYEIRAWAFNASDSSPVQSVVATRFVWVDATPPTVHISHPGHGAVLPYAQTEESIEIEVQAEDFGSELHEIVVQYDRGAGWTDFATLVEDQSGTVQWNPTAGPNLLRAIATDRFGNSAESDAVSVFVTHDHSGVGPDMALLSPNDHLLSVTPGGTVEFSMWLYAGSTLAHVDTWLNLEQISTTVSAGTNPNELIYSWGVPAAQPPGDYVLYYRAIGTSGADEAMTIIAIHITVE